MSMSFFKRSGNLDMSSIPFYVTRPDGEGLVYKWSVGGEMAILILMIGQLVILLWLIIALVAGLLVAGGAVVDLVEAVV